VGLGFVSLVSIEFLPNILLLQVAVGAVQASLALTLVEAAEVPVVIGLMCLDKPLDVTPLLNLS
jgi:hypothetical protein